MVVMKRLLAAGYSSGTWLLVPMLVSQPSLATHGGSFLTHRVLKSHTISLHTSTPAHYSSLKLGVRCLLIR